MTPATLLTHLMVYFTLAGNALTVVLLIMHVIAKPQFKLLMRRISERALILGFLLSTAATIGSFVYAEVTGFAACILCWIQRMFVYPQMFILGLGAWKNDRAIIPYTLMLSLLGGAVAFYNWVKDMLALYYPSVSLGCPDVAGLPSCDRIYILEFGYITIAMISLNIFVLLSIVFYAALRSEQYADA